MKTCKWNATTFVGNVITISRLLEPRITNAYFLHPCLFAIEKTNVGNRTRPGSNMTTPFFSLGTNSRLFSGRALTNPLRLLIISEEKSKETLNTNQ